MVLPLVCRQRRRVTVVKIGLALTLICGSLALGLRWRGDEQRRERGKVVFFGNADLPGRLAGHATALPRFASRCMNCHQTLDAVPVSPAEASRGLLPVVSKTFAAPLDRTWLSVPRSRHGGPPTAYDPASLCRLLRTGVDAGHVMVSTVMPRYDVSDAQCGDLHAYLTSQ